MSRAQWHYSGGVKKLKFHKKKYKIGESRRLQCLIKELISKHDSIEDFQPLVHLERLDLAGARTVRVLKCHKEKLLVLSAPSGNVEQHAGHHQVDLVKDGPRTCAENSNIHNSTFMFDSQKEKLLLLSAPSGNVEQHAGHHQVDLVKDRPRTCAENSIIHDSSLMFDSFLNIDKRYLKTLITGPSPNLSVASCDPVGQRKALQCRDVNIQCLLFKRLPVQLYASNKTISLRFVPEEDKICCSFSYNPLPKKYDFPLPKKDVAVQTMASKIIMRMTPDTTVSNTSTGDKSQTINAPKSLIGMLTRREELAQKTLQASNASRSLSMISESPAKFSVEENQPFKIVNVESVADSGFVNCGLQAAPPSSMQTACLPKKLEMDSNVSLKEAFKTDSMESNSSAQMVSKPAKIASTSSTPKFDVKNSEELNSVKENLEFITKCMSLAKDSVNLSTVNSLYIDVSSKNNTSKTSPHPLTPLPTPIKVEKPPKPETPKPVMFIDNDSAKQLKNQIEKNVLEDSDVTDSDIEVHDSMELSDIDTDLADVISVLDNDMQTQNSDISNPQETVNRELQAQNTTMMSQTDHNIEVKSGPLLKSLLDASPCSEAENSLVTKGISMAHAPESINASNTLKCISPNQLEYSIPSCVLDIAEDENVKKDRKNMSSVSSNVSHSARTIDEGCVVVLPKNAIDESKIIKKIKLDDKEKERLFAALGQSTTRKRSLPETSLTERRVLENLQQIKQTMQMKKNLTYHNYSYEKTIHQKYNELKKKFDNEIENEQQVVKSQSVNVNNTKKLDNKIENEQQVVKSQSVNVRKTSKYIRQKESEDLIPTCVLDIEDDEEVKIDAQKMSKDVRHEKIRNDVQDMSINSESEETNTNDAQKMPINSQHKKVKNDAQNMSKNSQNEVTKENKPIVNTVLESRMAMIKELKEKLGEDLRKNPVTSKCENKTSNEIEEKMNDIQQKIFFAFLKGNHLDQANAPKMERTEAQFLKSKDSSDLAFWDVAMSIVEIKDAPTANKSEYSSCHVRCADEEFSVFTKELNAAVENRNYSKFLHILQRMKWIKTSVRKQLLEETANIFSTEPQFNTEWESPLDAEYKNFVIGAQKFLSKTSWCEKVIQAAAYTPTLLLMCLQVLLKGRSIARVNDLKQVFLKLSLVLHLLSDGLFLEYDFDETEEGNDTEGMDADDSQIVESPDKGKTRLSEENPDGIVDDHDCAGFDDDNDDDQDEEAQDDEVRTSKENASEAQNKVIKRSAESSQVKNDSLLHNQGPSHTGSNVPKHTRNWIPEYLTSTPSCVLQTKYNPSKFIMRDEAAVVIDEDIVKNTRFKDERLKQGACENLPIGEKVKNIIQWFNATFTTSDTAQKKFIANLKKMLEDSRDLKSTYFIVDTDGETIGRKQMFISGPVDLNEKMVTSESENECRQIPLHVTNPNKWMEDFKSILKNDIRALQKQNESRLDKCCSLTSDISLFKITVPASQTPELDVLRQKKLQLEVKALSEVFGHDFTSYVSKAKFDWTGTFKIGCPFCNSEWEELHDFHAVMTRFSKHFKEFHTSSEVNKFIYYDTLVLFEAKKMWIDNPCSGDIPQVFVCYVCKYASVSRQEYYFHLLRHRSVATFYVCYQCKTSFPSHPALFSHYASEHDIKVDCPAPPKFTLQLPEGVEMLPDVSSKKFISGPAHRRVINRYKEKNIFLEEAVMKHPTMETFVEKSDNTASDYNEKLNALKELIWNLLIKNKSHNKFISKKKLSKVKDLAAQQEKRIETLFKNKAEIMELNKVTCLVCKVVFKSSHEKIAHHFDDHIFEHLSLEKKENMKKRLDEPLECEYCEEKVQSKFELYIHKYIAHNKQSVPELALKKGHVMKKGRSCKIDKSQKLLEFYKQFGRTKDVGLWLQHIPEELIYCDQCDRVFVPTLRSRFVQHLVEDHGFEAFKCGNCGRLFDVEDDFKDHQSRCESNSKKARRKSECIESICESCGKLFNDQKKMQYHSKRCSDITKSVRKCQRCSKEFTEVGIYRKHVAEINCTNDPNFVPVYNNKRHVSVNKRVCYKCSQKFANYNDYVHHMRLNCNNDPNFKGFTKKIQRTLETCPRCFKTFISPKSKDRHMKTVNCNDDPNFVADKTLRVRSTFCQSCPRCGKKLVTNASYVRHINVVNCLNSPDFVPCFDHIAKNNFHWDCPKCGKHFTKSRSVFDHKFNVNCMNEPNFIPRRKTYRKPQNLLAKSTQFVDHSYGHMENLKFENEVSVSGAEMSENDSLLIKQEGLIKQEVSEYDLEEASVNSFTEALNDEIKSADDSDWQLCSSVSANLPVNMPKETDPLCDSQLGFAKAGGVIDMGESSNFQNDEDASLMRVPAIGDQTSSVLSSLFCKDENSYVQRSHTLALPAKPSNVHIGPQNNVVLHQSLFNNVSLHSSETTISDIPLHEQTALNFQIDQTDESIHSVHKSSEPSWELMTEESQTLVLPPGHNLFQTEDGQFYLVPTEQEPMLTE